MRYFRIQYGADRTGSHADRRQDAVHSVRAADRYTAVGRLHQSQVLGQTEALVLFWTQLLNTRFVHVLTFANTICTP